MKKKEYVSPEMEIVEIMTVGFLASSLIEENPEGTGGSVPKEDEW